MWHTILYLFSVDVYFIFSLPQSAYAYKLMIYCYALCTVCIAHRRLTEISFAWTPPSFWMLTRAPCYAKNVLKHENHYFCVLLLFGDFMQDTFSRLWYLLSRTWGSKFVSSFVFHAATLALILHAQQLQILFIYFEAIFSSSAIVPPKHTAAVQTQFISVNRMPVIVKIILNSCNIFPLRGEAIFAWFSSQFFPFYRWRNLLCIDTKLLCSTMNTRLLFRMDALGENHLSVIWCTPFNKQKRKKNGKVAMSNVSEQCDASKLLKGKTWIKYAAECLMVERVGNFFLNFSNEQRSLKDLNKIKKYLSQTWAKVEQKKVAEKESSLPIIIFEISSDVYSCLVLEFLLLKKGVLLNIFGKPTKNLLK